MEKRLFHFLKDRGIFGREGNHRIRHYSDVKEIRIEERDRARKVIKKKKVK